MAKAKRRNVQQGFWDGTGFHPIRASSDYDSDRLTDDTEGSYRRKKKRKAKGKKRKNPTRNPLPVGRMVTVKARRRPDGKIDLFEAR
jgi:hypothetical protein